MILKIDIEKERSANESCFLKATRQTSGKFNDGGAGAGGRGGNKKEEKGNKMLLTLKHKRIPWSTSASGVTGARFIILPKTTKKPDKMCGTMIFKTLNIREQKKTPVIPEKWRNNNKRKQMRRALWVPLTIWELQAAVRGTGIQQVARVAELILQEHRAESRATTGARVRRTESQAPETSRRQSGAICAGVKTLH